MSPIIYLIIGGVLLFLVVTGRLTLFLDAVKGSPAFVWSGTQYVGPYQQQTAYQTPTTAQPQPGFSI